MNKLVKYIIIDSIIVVFAFILAWIMFNQTDDKLEIEKKWLIDINSIPYNLEEEDADKYDIVQTYIHYSPEIRVREIRHKYGTYYTMTIKRYVNDKGLTREEFDFEITEDEYNNTVVKGIDNTIYKTRYQIEIDGLTYAFDIFHEDLDGLAYLEIEFDSEAQANKFKEPDWVIKDITDDRRYKNQSLAQYGIPQE